MKTLTVITTTYNRDYCLHQVYDSLLRQTSDDFKWLIIDDGSIDSTKELVYKWISENKINISYHYKENGGMHTARNLAYELVDTELNVIIDSDDWLTDDAVEIIVDFWRKNGSDKYYGIISHNIDLDGNLIGNSFPENKKSSTITKLFDKYHVKGDKKLILRSDLSKLFPYPEFENEKFYPASYKFRNLDLDYELLILQKAVCVVDCNDNSMTKNKYAQYKSSPISFLHYRNEIIRISKSPKKIVKEMIHYITESKIAEKEHMIKNSAKPMIAILCYPAGCIYYHYLNKTKKKY